MQGCDHEPHELRPYYGAMSNSAKHHANHIASQILAAASPYARATAEAVSEMLWPTRCAICDELGETLCETCRHGLPYIDQNRCCPQCGAPFGATQCSECNTVMLNSASRDSVPFEQMVSVLSYDDKAKSIVSAYKDSGERRLAETMAELMSRCIPPSWLIATPVVTFVPASKRAYVKRGFDHIELLSSEISSRTMLELTPLLQRPQTRDQRKLSRNLRLANTQSRFYIKPDVAIPQSAIVVDDVCTTGATIYAACDALADAGVERLFCITFARV